MKRLDVYEIDLGRLTEGHATHTFVLDDAYFALLEGADIQKGSLTATVDVKRLTHDAYSLTIHSVGEVTVTCDRCLDEMQQPIDTTDGLTVRLGRAYDDAGDDVVTVPEDKPIINVAWFVYEFIALAVPMKHVHPEGQCNPDMAERLGQLLCNPADDGPADDDGAGDDDSGGLLVSDD